MDNDLLALLDLATSIAQEAGALLVEGQRSARATMSTKSSAVDVVTATDTAAEGLIVQRILQARPDDGILGEEGAERAATSGCRWIIDPIDGTANFVRGWNASVVSIGVEVDGELAVGVVHNPFTDDTHAAATGHGATRNGALLPRRDREHVDFAAAYIGVVGGCQPHMVRERAEVTRTLMLRAGDIRYTGAAAIDYCAVADGRLDGAFGNDYKIWDMAAGVVIAREAGCSVEGPEPGSPATPDRVLVAIPSVLDGLRAAVLESLAATSSHA